MKFRDMSTEMTEQEIITALYMICPDSLYKRYKREKCLIYRWEQNTLLITVCSYKD